MDGWMDGWMCGREEASTATRPRAKLKRETEKGRRPFCKSVCRNGERDREKERKGEEK